MSFDRLKQFIRDESASVTIEYLVLAGVLSMVWLAVGAEYQREVKRVYADLARTLRQIRI
ncbi:hypothetical protein [Cohaesibacter haloalkalitolerans]|uniref:hypothetical protein n=1 Tax=Cohaesibacter haloalkalitolerans TaxID=1162980 RepID=UPI000E648650|nr:hypothetical protein [Cohaesibacter haloalkalitolerans]